MKFLRKKTTLVYAGLALVAFLLAGSGCVAGNPEITEEGPAGFWYGLWHGMIALVSLVWGLFDDSLLMYEVNNSGGWYDFGFFIGLSVIYGKGASHGHERVKKRNSQDDEDWEEIGREFEEKFKRKVREWAETDEEDWEAIGKKAEAKLKKKIRKWLEIEEERGAKKGGSSDADADANGSGGRKPEQGSAGGDSA